MKERPQYHLPEEKQKLLKKAIRLEWITIIFISTIIVVMYITMGSSQAMKTAWLEDILGLVPPISFLVAMKFRNKKPNKEFPYGYQRVTLLAFLVAAVSILGLGLYMLYDSSMTLIKAEHPSLGHFAVFGSEWKIWSGWIMIIGLVYSIIPPVILGRMKLPLAAKLHEKTLHADASMNKDDWLTAVAAIVGILLLYFGFWWADAVAAGFISLDVIKDGVTNVKRAVKDLMDHRPTEVSDSKSLGVSEQIVEALRKLPEVRDADIRLHEEGHVISGEVFVILNDEKNVADQLEKIRSHAIDVDWRINNVVVMPVKDLKDEPTPKS